MFVARFKIAKLFGIPVQVDLSWFIIVALITWSLAKGVFPQHFKDLPETTYWMMGLAGALGLFVSILLHELGHSLVAQRYGLPIEGITLFIFGGVAEMTREPPSPKVEFLVAIAGPITSVLIAATCFALTTAGRALGWMAPVIGVLWYLGFINSVLVVFNMIPAFPLDGGRVFRSILWRFRGNLKEATRVTAAIGRVFGIVLIVLGAFNFMQGFVLAGVWQFVIGLFLRGAAQASYQQLLIRRALEGEPVSRFMQAEVIAVPPPLTIQHLVDDYIYNYHHKMYPVLDDGELLGRVTTRAVKQVPREQWSMRTVGQVVEPISPENTISPQADAMEALSRMHKNESSRLMVVDAGKLVGVVSLKDLVDFMALKVELEAD
jgi:Zn-dependent protease/predicted transcriptional regulator